MENSTTQLPSIIANLAYTKISFIELNRTNNELQNSITVITKTNNKVITAEDGIEIMKKVIKQMETKTKSSNSQPIIVPNTIQLPHFSIVPREILPTLKTIPHQIKEEVLHTTIEIKEEPLE